VTLISGFHFQKWKTYLPILYIKATVVVSVHPSVRLSCTVGAGQGDQTFSVTLRITDFWPRPGFGNFDLLLLLLLAAAAARIPDEISSGETVEPVSYRDEYLLQFSKPLKSIANIAHINITITQP